MANNGEVSLDNICVDMDFSKRMLLYYQKKLNDYLEESQLPLTWISGGMLKVDCNNKQQFQRLFNQDRVLAYVLESRERQDLILLEIGLSSQVITLESLCESLDISRSTLLTDLCKIKDYLSGHHISLQSKPRKGYFLLGDELRIRYVLMTAYYNMKSQVVTDMKENMLLKEASIRCKKKLDNSLFKYLKEIIYDSEKHTGKQFDYFSINDTVQNLLLVYLRSFHASASITDSGLRNYMENYSAELIIKKMCEMGLNISPSETTYVQVLLMGAKIYTLSDCTFDAQVDDFARELLVAFENISQIRLTGDTVLLQMLLLHIRPMFYRTKYQIKVSNTMGFTIQKTNNSFYHITQIAVESSSEKYHLYVDEDEITYLSLYFSCMGRFSLPAEDLSKAQILVVCGSGLGSSVYVKNQLEKILGNNYSYIISDVRNIQKSITDKAALMVSTVDLHDLYTEETIPVITVSTVISPEQKTQLINWMLENTAATDDSSQLSHIVDIVSKSADITNRERLVQDLRKYFDKDHQPDAEIHLEDIFYPQSVTLCREKVDWRQAMYIAGQPLIESNCIDRGYIDNIIEVIEESGPYAECQKGVLLAHAKPSEYVRRLSISVALFKEPLFMEKWNKTINVVFVLAATDYKSHATALVELISNLSQAPVFSRLADCETAEELYKLVRFEDK